MNCNCSHCDGAIGPAELSLKCCVCDDTYHLDCLSVTKQQFSRLTRDQKGQWKCHPCSNVTRRGRPTTTSLNRSVYTPSNCEDSMNMSCDNLEQASLQLSCSSGSTPAIVTDAASSFTANVDLKLISQELNKTLKGWRVDMDHAMTKFTNDIKGTLGSWREDMENSMSKFNDSIKCTIADFKSELNTLRCEHEKLKECFHTATHDVSELASSVQFLSAEQEDLKKRVDSIARDSSHQSQTLVTNLERKIDSLEQQARNCNVEICNVPERRGENLLHMMELLGTAINFPTSQKDIISIHRVQHAHQTSNRPKNIIVKFSTRIIRDNLLSAYRLAKELKTDQIGISGSPTRVYLNEHLTIKTKQLFRKCREFAKQHAFKYVWVKNSAILVRESDGTTVFAIRTLEDIQKLKSGGGKTHPGDAQNTSA